MLNSPKEWPANAARLAKLHEDTLVRPQREAVLELKGCATSKGSGVLKRLCFTCVLPREQMQNWRGTAEHSGFDPPQGKLGLMFAASF